MAENGKYKVVVSDRAKRMPQRFPFFGKMYIPPNKYPDKMLRLCG